MKKQSNRIQPKTAFWQKKFLKQELENQEILRKKKKLNGEKQGKSKERSVYDKETSLESFPAL